MGKIEFEDIKIDLFKVLSENKNFRYLVDLIMEISEKIRGYKDLLVFRQTYTNLWITNLLAVGAPISDIVNRVISMMTGWAAIGLAAVKWSDNHTKFVLSDIPGVVYTVHSSIINTFFYKNHVEFVLVLDKSSTTTTIDVPGHLNIDIYLNEEDNPDPRDADLHPFMRTVKLGGAAKTCTISNVLKLKDFNKDYIIGMLDEIVADYKAVYR